MKNTLSACLFLSLGALAAAPAHAVSINLLPQGATNFTVGQAAAQVTFDVTVSGLTVADEVLSAYDFGIAYNPSVLTLNTPAFAFTSLLGDEGLFEVFNFDHLDPDVNSLWDYSADHPALGAYQGSVLGTPDITAAGIINEGSLRFAQISLLDVATLRSLQDPLNSDGFTLFSLTFNVNTASAQSTDVLLIDDRAYADYGSVMTNLLDFKLSDPGTPTYPTLNNSSVSVTGATGIPEPGALWLLGSGLLALSLSRRRA